MCLVGGESMGEAAGLGLGNYEMGAQHDGEDAEDEFNEEDDAY